MPSTTRRRLLTATSAATVGLAGCTTDLGWLVDSDRDSPERRVDPDWRPDPGTWAERHYGPAKRRNSPHATPPRTEPEVDWRRDLDASLGDGSLIVVDETVYVATERRLLALDATDGATRWERDVAGPSGLKYVDGRLYQWDWSLREPDLVARSPDGAERWRTTVPEYVRGVHERDGYVFVAGRDRYWALHADTGDIVAERESWVRNVASDGDRLYAAFSGILVGYDADGRTLDERWRIRSDRPIESAQPVVGEELIYSPLYDPGRGGGVLVSDLSGETEYELELGFGPLHLTLTEAGPVVVPSATNDAGLVALGPDGRQRWTADVSGNAVGIAADGTVYAGTPVVAVDAGTGDRLWERDVAGVGGVGRLAAAGSTLYAATDDRVLALRA